LTRELPEILVSGGYVSDEIVARIQDEIRSDDFLANLLVQRGLLSEEEAHAAISKKTGVKFSNLSRTDLRPRVVHVLSRHLRSQFSVIPVRVESGKLLVAGTRVPPPEFYDAARAFTRLPIEFHLLSNANFLALTKEETAFSHSLSALQKAVHRKHNLDRNPEPIYTDSEISSP
jgi:hypothetical protein